MKLFGYILCGLVFALTAGHLTAAEVLPPEAFLRQVGKVGAAQKSFAVLTGEVHHYRKNSGDMERCPVTFAICFTGGKTEAVLTLDGGKERYTLTRDAFMRTHQVEPNQAGALLKKVGIEPADLVMGFMDGKFEREEARETLKTVPCRVLDLRGEEGKLVKVWIAAEYFFPLKAAFYGDAAHYGEAPEVVRTLELTGFKKVKERYVPTDMAVYAPDFRTRITFKECEVAEPDDPRGKAIFAKKPQKQEE